MNALWRAAAALTFAWALSSACSPGPESARGAAPAAPSQAEASADALGFVVRFEPPHPLAEAQALEAAGRCAEAEELARRTITARPELAGLCFERFTLGGAETVLTTCAASADGELSQEMWLERLRAMDGVAYADPNLSAEAVEC
jgi:hypothetical protein